MNAKQVVAKFVRPNWVPIVITFFVPILNFFTFIAFLTSVLPALLRANKLIKKLDESGLMGAVAAELVSANSKRFIKGKVVLSENYIFCKGTGYLFTYDEVLWAYKNRQTVSFLFIPLKVTDSLVLATKNVNPRVVASMGKDTTEEVKNAIVEIYNHNRRCLIGFTSEAQAQYKALKKN